MGMGMVLGMEMGMGMGIRLLHYLHNVILCTIEQDTSF